MGVAFSPDGSEALVANSWSGTVSVIDTSSNSVTDTITITEETNPKDPSSGVRSVVYSPDGDRAYVSQAKNAISVIDTQSNTVQSKIEVPGAMSIALAITPAGDKLYSADIPTGVISVIDTKTEKLTDSIKPVPGSYTISLAVSPDGSTLYAPYNDVLIPTGDDKFTANSTLVYIDTVTNKVVKKIEGSARATPGIAVSPDGEKLYVTVSTLGDDNKGKALIEVLDAAGGTVLDTIPLTDIKSQDGVGLVTAAPDGRALYAMLPDAEAVAVVDAQTYQTISSVPVGLGAFVPAVSPDSQTVYVTHNKLDPVTGGPGQSDGFDDTVSVLTAG